SGLSDVHSKGARLRENDWAGNGCPTRPVDGGNVSVPDARTDGAAVPAAAFGPNARRSTVQGSVAALFAPSQLMGTFKGFSERGLEFAAEIVAPYNATMRERPQLGQFLLIELGSPDEASLCRITRFVPSGLLASAEGEDYMNTMQRRQQDVPEELKQVRLKYRVHVKLLGAVRLIDHQVVYVPSQRRLPHLGASVAQPSADVLAAL